MKILFTWLKKIWAWIIKFWGFIVFALVLAVIVGLTFTTIKGCAKPSEQEQQIIAEKDQKIKDLNEQISNLEGENVRLTREYLAAKDKIAKLEKDKISITKPTSAKEIRERFGKLGYIAK